jgi:hypothetical protein
LSSRLRLRLIDQQEIDQLYALPPEQFTAARNELAKSLRGDGRKSDAETVLGLKRPSLGAWVLNQLARMRPQEIIRLVEAGERLRTIQASGKGDLRVATQEERAAAAELLAQARSILEDSGRTPSEAALQPVRATLAAAAADPAAADQLREGRLARELEPPVFGGLLGQMPRPGPGASKQAAQRATKAEERKALERELAEARARLSAAEHAAEELERHAQRLHGEWEHAKEEAKAAQAELKAAAGNVKAIERRRG